MKLSKLLFGLLLVWTAYGCGKREQSKFAGMWKLDRLESFDSLSSKWTHYPTDKYYTGYILYDGKGHMGVQITPKGYRDFDTSKNLDSLDVESLKALVRFHRSNIVYFANYELTESAIKHHRISASDPMDWGTTLTRDFEFKNDTLILTARESIGARKLRLRWVRL